MNDPKLIEAVARALEPKCRGFGAGDMPMAVAREFAQSAITAYEAARGDETSGLVPYAYSVGRDISIEKRGDASWAVVQFGNVLNEDGEWEWEQRPSSRSEDFKKRTRFSLDEAKRRAMIAAAKGE